MRDANMNINHTPAKTPRRRRSASSEALRAGTEAIQHQRLLELADLLAELDELLPRLDAGQLLRVLMAVEAAFSQTSATVATLRALLPDPDADASPTLGP
jgi:hypothetical protein